MTITARARNDLLAQRRTASSRLQSAEPSSRDADRYQSRIDYIDATIDAHPKLRRDPAIIRVSINSQTTPVVTRLLDVMNHIILALEEFTDPRHINHSRLAIDTLASIPHPRFHQTVIELAEALTGEQPVDPPPAHLAARRLMLSVEAAVQGSQQWPIHTTASAYNATRELIQSVGHSGLDITIEFAQLAIAIPSGPAAVAAYHNMTPDHRPPVSHDPFAAPA